MTRATKTRELTFEEYLEIPETNLRQEVIDGVIVMSPSPTFEHQLILGDLYTLLREFTARHDLGTVVMAPSDILIRKIPKLRVRQPDIRFIRSERASREDLKKLKILEIAPDLAVEILSPEESAKRLAEKLGDFVSIKVPELWLIDPEAESVEVHTLAGGCYVLSGRFEKDEEVRSAVLPGLALPVHSIFA